MLAFTFELFTTFSQVIHFRTSGLDVLSPWEGCKGGKIGGGRRGREGEGEKKEKKEKKQKNVKQLRHTKIVQEHIQRGGNFRQAISSR